MPSVMFDSVTPSNIPANATMVAGYTSGNWPTYPTLVKQFPKATVVSIAVNAMQNAQVLDVEQGDATPTDVPGWLFRQRARGITPVVYCSVAAWPAVQDACKTARIAPPLWWSADWTGRAHLTPGAVATQWADGTANYPGLKPGCDTSYVSDLAPWAKKPKATVVSVVKSVIKAVKPTKPAKQPAASPTPTPTPTPTQPTACQVFCRKNSLQYISKIDKKNHLFF